VAVNRSCTAVPAVIRDHVATWWNIHERGTNDRPRPGTQLCLVGGRGAVVLPYEGCWPSHTFPVWIDGDPGPRIAIAADVDRDR
jgi:hypothetical protein